MAVASPFRATVPASNMSDAYRITSLPIIAPPNAEDIEAYNREWVYPHALFEGFRIKLTQVWGALSYRHFGGLLGLIAVGEGKTLLAFLIASEAIRNGKKKVLLLVPSQGYPQMTDVDIPWASRRVRLPYEFIKLGEGRSNRLAQVASNFHGCYIMPYSLLSLPHGTEMLEDIHPDLIISDESHRLKNRNTARTKRLLKYFEKHPSTQLVAMSGTITKKSIKDFAHLARWALRDLCPTPIHNNVVEDWSCVLDTDGSFDTSLVDADIMIGWAKNHFSHDTFEDTVEGFRKAFRYRLESCPGVVTAYGTGVDSSLVLSNFIGPNEFGPRLQTLIDKVETFMETPNGDPISHAMLGYKWLYELNAGFYNELYWPEVSQIAEEPWKYCSKNGWDTDHISLPDAFAEQFLALAKEAKEAYDRYQTALREWLRIHYIPGIDTPMSVGQDMELHGSRNVGEALYAAWKESKEAFDPRLPVRQERSIRVDPFKIQECVKWIINAPQDRPVLVWYFHQEIGNWVAEALRNVLNNYRKVLHCPAGDKHNERIINREAMGTSVVVASIMAHHEAKNLQFFGAQYFVQWPRDAAVAEQAIGRVHRQGQDLDEVHVFSNIKTPFDRELFGACLNDAIYCSDVSKPHKLLIATYNPPPFVFTVEFLNRKGFSVARLTEAQQKLAASRFVMQEVR